MNSLLSKISNKKSNMWWHIITWIVIYMVYSFILSFVGNGRAVMLINLHTLFIYMVAYYSLKYFQIPKFYDKGNILKLGISLIASSILLYIFYYLGWYLWLGDAIGYKGRYHYAEFQNYLLLSIRFYSPALAIIIWESHAEHRKERKRTQALEQEKITNELRFLKAQINPHFLFNSLNNLYSFVITESAQAPDMIDRLTHILDYVLDKSQYTTVPLVDEIDTISNYIALEYIRYGDRLEVTLNKDSDLMSDISPLILLSIVENAFKHGASGDIEKPIIKIDIHDTSEEIHFNVWNTKSRYKGEINDAYKEGIGIKNIQRQLDIIYPNQHNLGISETTESFNVSLTINSKK